MTTTAQIAAKGCSSTGITEELADKLHAQLGRKVVAVVEMVAEARTENRNGDEKVVLNILTVEPAPTKLTEDYLRNLQRAFYYERKVGEDGPQLAGPDDGPEPSVKDVLTQGIGVLGEDDKGEPVLLTDDDLDRIDPLDVADPDDPAYEPHPFLPESGSSTCAVCELGESANIHVTQDDPVPG